MLFRSLQSLGDLALPESRTRAFAALGNAVNANVVAGIASNLIADFNESLASGVRPAHRQVVHA